MNLSNLPPGVTNADIEAHAGQAASPTGIAPRWGDGVLSSDCEDVLEKHEMFSKSCRRNPQAADIFDCEGRRLFTVTKTISLFDLANMIRYGTNEFERGQQAGAESVRIALRGLIGAAKEAV